MTEFVEKNAWLIWYYTKWSCLGVLQVLDILMREYLQGYSVFFVNVRLIVLIAEFLA